VGVGRGIHVGCMTGAEAERLLADLSGCDVTFENCGVVTEVLERLDRLPLAVSQAAFYIRETTTPFEDYLTKLHNERRRWKLLAAAGPSRHRQEDVPNSVIHTWRITMDYLRHENPLAHQILRVIVYFNHQNIPLSIIKAAGETRIADSTPTSTEDGKEDERDELQNSEGDSEDEDERILIAVTRLAQFSFLKLRAGQGESRSYDLHKLVQEATRYAVRHDVKRGNRLQMPTIALDILLERFPSGDYRTWNQSARLLSHALTVCEWQELVSQKLQISKLLSRVFTYLLLQGRSGEAEEIIIKILQLRKEVLGEKHPNTIKSMADLAATYHQQGRSDEAEEIFINVLQLRKEMLGQKHPDTIRSMADLAATYHQQGRSDEDEEISIKILQLRKEVLGEKHPDTIESMADLAACRG
jgi:Tetratricopeptide repeat